MTETQFANTAVRLWRAIQRVQKAKAELKRRGITCRLGFTGDYKPTYRNKRAAWAYEFAFVRFSTLSCHLFYNVGAR